MENLWLGQQMDAELYENHFVFLKTNTYFGKDPC